MDSRQKNRDGEGKEWKEVGLTAPMNSILSSFDAFSKMSAEYGKLLEVK